MRRNAAPCLHVFEERCILPTSADGVREAAFDTAEAYHHILSGLDTLGCLARVLVGESADVLAGEIPLDGSCHLIDKPEHCTRLATIFLHQFLTILALARILIVVLRHRIDEEVWIIGHYFLDATDTDTQHFLVRKAKLVGGAFSSAQTEVFGMFLEIDIRFAKLIEGMHRPESLTGHLDCAVVRLQDVLASMGLVAQCPFGIERIIVIQIA